MAEYHLQTTNLPDLKEKHSVYPRLVAQEPTYVKDLLKKICNKHNIPYENAENLVENLFQLITHTLSDGGTVRAEHFGTFSITLSKQTDFQDRTSPSTADPVDNIVINNIRFKAEKQTMNWIRQNCNLVRIEFETASSSEEYSLAEREQMAIDFLKKNYVISTKDYCLLTGLQRNKAVKELKKLAETHNGIRIIGKGTHKIYSLEPKNEP